MKMSYKSFLSFFCFVLVSSGVVSAQVCSNTAGSFRPNSTFDVNRRLVLSYLPSNVTSQGGFYNTSVGQEPNRVYVAGMCIPGAQAQACSDCLKDTSDDIIRNCNKTEAFSWPGNITLCFVRYSNRSFYGTLNLEPSLELYNTGDLRSNLTDFDRIWEELTLRMIAAASSGEGNASPSNRIYYAANVAALTSFQNIYALMQCTPDISPGDCNYCLLQSVGDYHSCCRGKQGGVVMRSSCFFRWDLYPYSGAFSNITLAPPPPPMKPSQNIQTKTTKNGSGISAGTVIAIVVPTVVVFLVLLAVGFAVCWRRKLNKEIAVGTGDDITITHSLQFDFKTLEAATNKFSESNRLGGGGFGEVYRARFMNGTEVAVKRLSKASGQGTQEFKNEVVLVAKLQHRNLVRLLGFCVEGEEKILVYQFLPNKSLDYFLFDPTKQNQLDWTIRNNIIGGIARGVLYLHQDSRLTIIHRDLKASNILLDSDMNPKIADFGMARTFGMDQTQANTNRIVGTYGYMSPEYVMHGKLSMKSDVYSFGVLVLEIVSGKKNSSFYQIDGNGGNLITHAWRLWRNGSPLELVDPSIGDNYQSDEVTRYIHIGLLCVQEDPADRPTMSTIILMLTSNTITLPVPRQPGFFFQSRHDQDAAESQ